MQPSIQKFIRGGWFILFISLFLKGNLVLAAASNCMSSEERLGAVETHLEPHRESVTSHYKRARSKSLIFENFKYFPSQDGLMIFSSIEQKRKTYTIQDGLGHNMVYDVFTHPGNEFSGMLVATKNGLSIGTTADLNAKFFTLTLPEGFSNRVYRSILAEDALLGITDSHVFVILDVKELDSSLKEKEKFYFDIFAFDIKNEIKNGIISKLSYEKVPNFIKGNEEPQKGFLFTTKSARYWVYKKREENDISLKLDQMPLQQTLPIRSFDPTRNLGEIQKTQSHPQANGAPGIVPGAPEADSKAPVSQTLRAPGSPTPRSTSGFPQLTFPDTPDLGT